MKSRFLFPHKWRITGLILFVFGAIIFIVPEHYFFQTGGWLGKHLFNFGTTPYGLIDDTIDVIVYLSGIIGLLLIGFSKEKIEDEQIAQLRSDSLQWAIYVNYGILIVCIIFVNNGPVALAVIAYNIITPLIFFIIRFRWKIYQLNSSLKQQEKLA